MSKTEQRLFNFDITAEKRDENTGVLTGLPIVFEQATDLGYFTEIIDRNALDACDMRDVPFLVNHNTNMIPLARSRNNNANSTMQLSVGENGLNIRVNLDVDGNSESKNLYSAVSRGDVSGMSFMFTVDKDSWEGMDTDKPTRRINSIGKVYELSAVTFPAYSQTSISVERSAAEALESARAALESAREQAAAEEKRNNLIDEIRKYCACGGNENET